MKLAVATSVRTKTTFVTTVIDPFKFTSNAGIAEYSTVDGRLRIPALEVNLNGSISVATNVVFVLTDAATASFTLESFDQ